MATRFVRELEAAAQLLRHQPLAGPPREHLAPGLRVLFHKHYGIYYLPRETEILLIRVLHGARDIPALFR